MTEGERLGAAHRDPRATRRIEWGVATAIVLLATGLLMGNWLGGGLPISHRGEVLTEMAITWMARHELLQGHLLSEWNPLWFSGFPWLRFLSYPMYYPLAALSAWGGIPLETVVVIFYYGVFAASALTFFAYLRSVLSDWRAALLGALIYEVFPFHCHVGVETWIHAAFWVLVPVPLWAAEKARTRGWARVHYGLIGGLALGLMPVVSSEYTIVVGPFVVLYLLARQVGDVLAKRMRWHSAVALPSLVGVVALGICAFFVLPGLMETNSVGIHAKHGGGTTFTDALLQDYAITPRLVWYAVLKRLHLPASTADLPGIVSAFWSVSWYPGIVVPLLALVGVTARWGRFDVSAAVAGLALGALMVLGPTLPMNPISRVPVLGRLSPFRSAMILVACGSVLAAHGAERLLTLDWPSPWLRWLPWVLPVCLILAIGFDFKGSASAFQTTGAYFTQDEVDAYTWLAQHRGTGRLWDVSFRPRDLYLRSYALHLAPLPRYDGYYDNGAPLHTWQQMAWTEPAIALELHSVRYILLRHDDPDAQGLWRELPEMGYAPAHVVGECAIWENPDNGEYARLYAHSVLDASEDIFVSFAALPDLVRRGMALVAMEGRATELDATTALARHDRVLVSPQTERAVTAVLGDRAQRRLVGDEVAQLDRPAFPRPSLWVERAGYESILVEAESLTGGILTVAESWYPHWRVYVDGTPRPLLRCNWSLLGVHLEPGRHHVSFRYQRPTYMYVGYAISLVTVLLMVLWWSWYIGRTLEVERLVVSQLSAEPPSRGTHGPIND